MNRIKGENIMQGWTYQKYYQKINIFYFRNKVHWYKKKLLMNYNNLLKN
jgi:hypothetical protein